MFKFQYKKTKTKTQQVREVFLSPDNVFYFEMVWPEIKVRDCV